MCMCMCMQPPLHLSLVGPQRIVAVADVDQGTGREPGGKCYNIVLCDDARKCYTVVLRDDACKCCSATVFDIVCVFYMLPSISHRLSLPFVFHGCLI